MRTFELLVAIAPLAMYLVLLGGINLRRRPYVLSGARESLLVGIALFGLAVVGPLQLFFPQQAANQFGRYIWPLLITFYLLVVFLWILLGRPRLIVYNISSAQLRAVLSETAIKLDPDARWAGDSLALPQMNVQLHLDVFDWMRNVTLVSTGGDQSYTNWRRLEGALRASLSEITVPRNPRGYSFMLVGVMLIATLAAKVVKDSEAIAQGLIDFLRL